MTIQNECEHDYVYDGMRLEAVCAKCGDPAPRSFYDFGDDDLFPDSGDT